MTIEQSLIHCWLMLCSPVLEEWDRVLSFRVLLDGIKQIMRKNGLKVSFLWAALNDEIMDEPDIAMLTW